MFRSAPVPFYRLLLCLLGLPTVMQGADLCNSGDPQPVRVEVKALKKSAQLGMPMPVIYRLTNCRTFRIEPDRDYELKLEVRDAVGNLVTPRDEFRSPEITGPINRARIEPGQSYEKRTDINDWVILGSSGLYEVRGVFSGASSEPIQFRVDSKPSQTQTEVRLRQIAQAIRTEKSLERLTPIVKEAMYTGDPAAIPMLIGMDVPDPIKSMFNMIAFRYYLPREPYCRALTADKAKFAEPLPMHGLLEECSEETNRDRL
jgi:hypothetical protein